MSDKPTLVGRFLAFVARLTRAPIDDSINRRFVEMQQQIITVHANACDLAKKLGTKHRIVNARLDALEAHPVIKTPTTAMEQAQAAADQAVAAPQPAQQEPVAYWIPKAEQFCIADPSGRPFAKAWEPLYASPQPAQRKPLTTQEIRKWWASENGLEDCVMSKLDDFEQVVRAIEAAHNIKDTP